MKVGCTTDFDTFVAAVIDETAFDRITPFIDRAKKSHEAEIIVGLFLFSYLAIFFLVLLSYFFS